MRMESRRVFAAIDYVTDQSFDERVLGLELPVLALFWRNSPNVDRASRPDRVPRKQVDRSGGGGKRQDLTPRPLR